MNPPRHGEHVRDVFRAGAGGAWGCESGVVQVSRGPIQSSPGERRRFFRQIAVGLSLQAGGGKRRAR